jgi:antitoxin YefM
MVTVYRTNADDLDDAFVESVRAAFKGKDIEIVVTEHDETEYLLSSRANREKLLSAVQDIEAGTNVVRPEESDLR